MEGYYKSVRSGCLECEGGGAPEAIAFIIGGVVLMVLVYKLFKRYFAKNEQTHIKTVAKISFVAGQTLVKLPVTFGVQFPAAVRFNRV